MRFSRAASVVLALCLLLIPAQAYAVPNSKPAESISSYDASNPQELMHTNLYGQSAILIDARTGEVLFSKNANDPLYPASITKILTAMVVLERCSLDETVTAQYSKMQENKLEATWLKLEDGEQFKVRDMLYGLLMKSYNDFAAALAAHVAGSIPDFAEMMNRKAAELGCTDTKFTTPHGLNDSGHYTTVSDMAKIARAAMQNETIRQIVSTYKYTLPASNKRTETTEVINTNRMLPGSESEFAYDGCIGVKTGYHSEAQHTFVCAAQRDGVNLLCVIMGTTGEGKWLDATKLLDYGFASYERLDIAAMYAAEPVECVIEGAIEGDSGTLRLELGDTSAFGGVITRKGTAMLPDEFASKIQVNYTSPLTAPIRRGDKIAEMTYALAGGGSATADLLASRDVLEAVIPANAEPANLASSSVGAPPTLTDIAVGIEQSPTRYLALLLLVPVIILIGLVISMLLDVSRRKKRLRGRISRSRGY